MKDGIMEKKDNMDEDIVAEAYIEGFEKGIKPARLMGRLA
jgi:hypothetical protein